MLSEDQRLLLAIVLAVIAFIIAALLEALLLPVLRRLKAGQSIREEGPKAHMAKSGTPTMGGLAIVLGFILCSINYGLFFSPEKTISRDTLVICFVTLAYAAIGFIDDYIKVVKKRNLGLTAIQKLALQIFVALILAIYAGNAYGTMVGFPILGLTINFRLFYYPFVVFVVVAMTNAVNLTDGLDGLASSVTAIVALCFTVVARNNLNAFAAAIILYGCCLAFLLFNHHPAKVFMGDTGSLALGGALSAIAIISKTEFVLPVAGIIYVIEALSVIIQVFVFKTQNGRRFFRMAPIHHHFELGGMKETKVVIMFCIVTTVFCALEILVG